ncbi:MAG: hypothetical protein Q8L37_03975 [Candidatus Gottesmanbacteria bacterium]|nr:hypothetical protein [Candidatus Gottesmanbacteria bacterium]
MPPVLFYGVYPVCRAPRECEAVSLQTEGSVLRGNFLPARNALPEAAASLQAGAHSVAGGPRDGHVSHTIRHGDEKTGLPAMQATRCRRGL